MSLGTVLVGIVDVVQRTGIVGALERAGFEAQEAHDGGRLLDLARRLPPDLILIGRDLIRPDALEATRRLASDAVTRSVPILILGRGAAGEAAEALEAGASASLPSTASEIDLIAHVRSLSRGGRPSPESDDAHRALLLELTRVMTSDRDPRSALHAAVHRIAAAVGAVRGGVLLLSSGGRRALVLASAPPEHARDRINLAAHPTLLAAAVEARWTVAEDPGADPLSVSNNGGALLSFPVLFRGVAIGLLVLRLPERVAPDARAVRLAELVALVAAAPLVTAREVARGGARLRKRAAERGRVLGAEGILGSRSFLQRLIDASRDAVIASDMRGTVLVFNEAAERITGWRAADLVGRVSVSELYPSGVAKEIMRKLRAAQPQGGHLSGIEVEILSRDGTPIPILLSGAVIYGDDGREIATTGYFTDLRDRRAMEKRLKEAQSALIQTEKQAAVAELAGSAAHELNQPLTAVMGYAELLLKRLPADDPNRKHLTTIYEEAERMAAVVKKIGRITRYESQSYVGGTRIVDLEKSSRS